MSEPIIEANEQAKTVRIEIQGSYSPGEARKLAAKIQQVADKLSLGPRGGGLW